MFPKTSDGTKQRGGKNTVLLLMDLRGEGDKKAWGLAAIANV